MTARSAQIPEPSVRAVKVGIPISFRSEEVAQFLNEVVVAGQLSGDRVVNDRHVRVDRRQASRGVMRRIPRS